MRKVQRQNVKGMSQPISEIIMFFLKLLINVLLVMNDNMTEEKEKSEHWKINVYFRVLDCITVGLKKVFKRKFRHWNCCFFGTGYINVVFYIYSFLDWRSLVYNYLLYNINSASNYIKI